MSIAAAENAGLGPRDQPDPWVSNTTISNNNNNISNSSISIVASNKSALSLLSSLSPTETTSSTRPAYININSNINSNSAFFKNNSRAITANSSTIAVAVGYPTTSTAKAKTAPTGSHIYKLPLPSPAAATAAVTVSTAGSSSVVTASLVGLANSIPSGAPLTGTGSGGVGGVADLLLAAAPSTGAGGSGVATQTATATVQVNIANNNVNNSGSAGGGSQTHTLQQQQQQQLQLQQNNNLLLHNNNNLNISLNNNNNILLNNHNKNSNNNNYNLILRQKAAAAASLAAALQNSITMNAVASPISNNPATPTRKIRRKTDPKANLPQSQINKCNNEKRRRELENNYIEQLSEFLQLNKRGDMTSTKPDKAAILNQVVKTYREFCDKGQNRDISSSASANSSSSTNATSPNNKNTNTTSTIKNNNKKNNITSTRCARCATDNCSIHPVQQGDVSSTEPPLPEPSLLNGQVPEISAYFEALEHYLSSVDWVLLQVTADGIIESCTQNIRELIGYDKQELYCKPLYQYLHPGDHAKLDPIINNMSYGGGGNTSSGVGGTGCGSGWADQDDGNSGASSQHSATTLGPSGPKAKRNIAAKVRMQVKDMRSATQTTATASMTHPNDAMDQKNIRTHVHLEKYEEVMLLATPVKDDGDSTSSILCLITRPEDEPTMQQMQPQPIEHLTFKLDVHGKILNLDATAIREPYRLHLSSWLGRLLQDLCHPQDLSALKTHLREVQESAASVHLMNSPAAQSPGGTPATLINPPIANVMSRPFRLRLGAPDVYVHVKANSRLFLNQSQTEGDYIMSLQTILNSDIDVGSGSVSGSGNVGAIPSSGLSTMSPSPSLVSPLSLPLDSLVNNNSCSSSSSSAMVGVASSAHLLGGLVGGGGMPPHTPQTTNVGGPLMTSAVINGTGSSTQRNNAVAAPSASTSNNSTLVNSFTASPAGPEATIFYSADPFDFDLAHSSFEMDATGWTDSRPNSRASVTTPVSTPRPPSTGHGFSPAVCASPSTPYQLSSHSAASLPSPQSNASQPSSAGPGGSGGSFGFGFPAFDSTDKNSDKEHMNNSGNNSTIIGSTIPGHQGGQIVGGGGGNLPNGGPSLLATVGGMGQPLSQSTPPQPDSERLRHLLTNKSLSMPSSMHSVDGDKDHINIRHKFHNQGLLNSDDDKDGGGAGGSNRGSSGMFKMGAAGITGARLFGGGALPKSANTSNPMLLSLLNEKSEDDDGKGSALGRQSELMRQLQKDDGHYGHSHGHGHGPHHSKDMSQEDLLKSLKYQGDPTTRKRSLNESDDGISAKRDNDRPSKLRENNKMLASLLENPPKNPIVTVPPQVKTIPDIAPTTSRVSSTLGGIGVSTPSSLGGMPPKSSSMTTTSATSASSTVGGGGRSSGLRKHFSDAYLTLQQQQQHQQQCLSGIQRPPQQQPAQQSQPQISFSPTEAFGTSPHNTTATSGTAVVTASIVNSQPNSELAALSGVDGDSELSKILDSVMDYVSDDGPFVSTPNPTAMAGLTQQEINKRMAINAIQNSLMVETSQLQQQQHHQQQSQPPAYPGGMVGSGGGLTQQQQHQLHIQQLQILQRQQGIIGSGQQSSQVQQMLEMLRASPNQAFQRPPPMYPAARNRGPMNAVTTPGGTVLPAHQQYRIRQQQQQQKERLLQQQQKQQLLVPESANARTDQLCLNPSINNIGSLLNNTVAPNVALSRTNLPPDSQLSPSFAQSLLQQQQQLSPGQRNAAFSPQANAGYGSQFAQSGQRLSPHQQQHLSQQQQVNVQQQQQQMAFQAAQSAGANVAAQLSPRQPSFGGGSGGSSVQSPSGMPNTSPQQWGTGGNGVGSQGTQLSGNATTQRGHSLQQHNPMLSAQLQGVSPYTARPYQNQRRSLNSPSGGGVPGNAGGSTIGANVALQRQNSFQGGETGGFSGTPGSPSPQSPYGGPSSNVFQQQQLQRMQRQSSVPQTTQHLPGSPRPFGANLNHDNIVCTSGNGAASSLGMNGGVSVGVSVGVGSFGSMMYNNMQHAARAVPPPQTPNDFYGRAQTAGNASNSSDFVKQELRAVVSVRAQQQAAAAGAVGVSASGNGVPGSGGGGGNGGPVGPSGLRISNTPQSPLNNTQLGPMIGGGSGGPNPLSMQQQQQQTPGTLGAGSGSGAGQNSLLNTPPDPTMNFSFDTQDFFGSSTTR